MTDQQVALIDRLSETYEEWFVNAAFRIVGDAQTAKDIVQEAFWTACLRIEKLETHENPVGWMFTTIHHLATREMSRAYRANEQLTDSLDAVGTTEIDLPMEHYFPRGLSQRERTILLLRLDKGLSYDEVAEHLGIRVDACRQQYSRAIIHCRTLMAHEDMEPAKF